MASFTAIDDTLVLDVPARGENIALAISGTYNMTILFQREKGSPGSGSFETLLTFNTEDATEAANYTTKGENERLRFLLSVDAGGTATVTLTDVLDQTIRTIQDRIGDVIGTWLQSGLSLAKKLTVTGLSTLNGATILRTPDGSPIVTKVKVPSTSTTGTSMTEAELFGGIHVKTPSAAQNFQVPTGTEIDAEFLSVMGVAVAAGDSFDLTIVNLGGAGDILTLTVDTGVTFVGSVLIDDAGADITSSGTFRFRNVSAAVWIAYRVA